MQYVKIPKDRVAVLIGENGKTKKEIEGLTKTKLLIEDGSVSIDGESVDEWVAKDVVKAVARGFSPEKAMTLTDDETVLDIIPLEDVVGSSEKSIKRFKGRIIGEKGKSRRLIENLTDTYVSVYGKTVSIIGTYEKAPVAKEAILRLLEGASHPSVYRFLERSIKGKTAR